MPAPQSVRDRTIHINYGLRLADHELIEQVQTEYAYKSRSEALQAIVNEWALATGRRSLNADFIPPAVSTGRN